MAHTLRIFKYVQQVIITCILKNDCVWKRLETMSKNKMCGGMSDSVYEPFPWNCGGDNEEGKKRFTIGPV